MGTSGSCHCGAVTFAAPSPPDWVVQCGCSICSKLGVLWAYYPDNTIVPEGKTATYSCNNHVIGFHRCVHCGCTTHWKTLGKDFGRMAINARLLETLDRARIQIRVVEQPTAGVFADSWPPAN